MGISDFFEIILGVKLRNFRWSWGAVDPTTNRVFLRVWQDHIEQDGDSEKVQVYWKNPLRKSLGLPERLKHIEAVKNGSQCFGIVCMARDPHTTEARKIRDFKKDIFLQLGNFTEDDDCIYAHITAYIPRSELNLTKAL